MICSKEVIINIQEPFATKIFIAPLFVTEKNSEQEKIRHRIVHVQMETRKKTEVSNYPLFRHFTYYLTLFPLEEEKEKKPLNIKRNICLTINIQVL